MKKILALQVSAAFLALGLFLTACSSDPNRLARQCDLARSAIVAYEASIINRVPSQYEVIAHAVTLAFVSQRCLGVAPTAPFSLTKDSPRGDVVFVTKFPEPQNEFQVRFNAFLKGIGKNELKAIVYYDGNTAQLIQ